MALSFHHAFELPVTVVRPFNTYGPRQSARAVIPTILAQLHAGRGDPARLARPRPATSRTSPTRLAASWRRQSATGPSVRSSTSGTGRRSRSATWPSRLITASGRRGRGRRRPLAAASFGQRGGAAAVGQPRAREWAGWEPEVSLEEGLRGPRNGWRRTCPSSPRTATRFEAGPEPGAGFRARFLLLARDGRRTVLPPGRRCPARGPDKGGAPRVGRHLRRSRITAELRDNGERVNHKRVARVMRIIDLAGVRLRRRHRHHDRGPGRGESPGPARTGLHGDRGEHAMRRRHHPSAARRRYAPVSGHHHRPRPHAAWPAGRSPITCEPSSSPTRSPTPGDPRQPTGAIMHTSRLAGGFNRSSNTSVRSWRCGWCVVSRQPSGDSTEAEVTGASEVPASCRGRFRIEIAKGLLAEEAAAAVRHCGIRHRR